VIEFNDSKGNPIDLDKHYTLATKYYLALGKDGWTALSENKHLIEVI
jgi:2',3'-cyclic-nucleotide 2'-phosphodiesterase (5'-nucleotidase family)